MRKRRWRSSSSTCGTLTVKGRTKSSAVAVRSAPGRTLMAPTTAVAARNSRRVGVPAIICAVVIMSSRWVSSLPRRGKPYRSRSDDGGGDFDIAMHGLRIRADAMGRFGEFADDLGIEALDMHVEI